MSSNQIIQRSESFVDYLEKWLEDLPVLSLDQIVSDPEKVAIISEDMVNGFCYEGPLASPRVQGIIRPIVNLFEMIWETGVRNILLSQDSHEPDAIEFDAYPSHCVRGSSQAEPVPEIKALPFFDQMTIFPKNSISIDAQMDLGKWLLDHPEVEIFIVVGDCTDICIYQLAMYLRTDANERQIKRRVIVPVNCVQTYDMQVDLAIEIGALPHDGDFLHGVFLYHMALNKIEVVQEIR
ncbi:MAG: isochorismatase family protein [Anaerolineaceae bacterium]|nr:isochorismatase family protein [Anaerolineaceae bacterium]